jgi:hypothetical protein
MDTHGGIEDLNAHEKRTDWYDRTVKAGLLLIGILNLVQDRTSWFPYAFLSVLILLMVPFFRAQWSNGIVKLRQYNAKRKFSNDFKNHVMQAGRFVQGSDQYGIAFNMRGILSRFDPSLGGFSSPVEGAFSSSFGNLERRVQRGFKKYDEFNEASREFSDLMSAFVSVYADQVIHEANRPENRPKLQNSDLADMKRKYDALSRFIDGYNEFRGKVAVYLRQTSANYQIRIPYEALQ